MGVEVAIIFENNYELRANNLSSSLIVLKVIILISTIYKNQFGNIKEFV